MLLIERYVWFQIKYTRSTHYRQIFNILQVVRVFNFVQNFTHIAILIKCHFFRFTLDGTDVVCIVCFKRNL